MARSTYSASCIKHAKFASHLDRAHFDGIYWSLFTVVIFMLFAASWSYGRSIDDVANMTPGSPEHRRRMKRCMLVCGVYAIVSVVSVVMEVFALMALQFCDGEELMSLYWSTWTVMQIGSLIAIFGVLLAVFHTIRGRKHPPWALALGTPVLVVAGLGHVFQGALRKKVKRVRARNSMRRKRSEDQATTTTETIAAEDSEKDESEYQYSAKLLGYTPDGATILQFCQPFSSGLGSLLSQTAQARIIGSDGDGLVIVAFGDGKSTLPSSSCNAPNPPPVPESSSSAGRSGASVTIQEPLPMPTCIKFGDQLAGRTTTPAPQAQSNSESSTVPGSGGSSARDKVLPTSAVVVSVTRSDSPASADGGLSLTPHHAPRGAMSD